MSDERYTLGIEEEFQIVDPQTRELRSRVSEMLDEGRMLLGEQVKPEMIQAQIEVGTGICHDIQEARRDITRLRSIVSSLARKQNLRIIAASTHPISQWTAQDIYDDPHYKLLIEELQMVARSLLIFGMHVHVGIADRERQPQREQGALGDFRLRVHVEAARADVLRAGDARQVGAVVEHVDDEPRALEAAALLVRLLAVDEVHRWLTPALNSSGR